MKTLRKAVLWWGFRSLCRCVAALGRLLYGLEAHGIEHLPREGPLVVMCRRTSRVDFFPAALFCSRMRGLEFSVMTGALVIPNSRFIAWVGQEMGFLPTVKGRGMSATSLLKAYKLLRQGLVVGNADEGEVSWDGRLQSLRSGAAWLALRSHAPLVVGVVQGGYDIWPRWARRPHLSGKLILKLGKPFYLSDSPCERVTEPMLQEANKQIVAELVALSDGYMHSKGSLT